MRMTNSRASLLLLTLAGCVHQAPDEAVLAPLVAQFTQEPFDESNQPEYLIFADEITANVFKSLRRDSRYRILPSGKPFTCPSDASPCPQPHELSVHVRTVMGDSAIATIERTYYKGAQPARPVRASEQILLVRRKGKWKIEKVLGYELGVLG
jgi:hypothetical protein